jgi:hypothetical protein
MYFLPGFSKLGRMGTHHYNTKDSLGLKTKQNRLLELKYYL